MARICIVTPGQLASNPRVVKEAAALNSAGHQVTTIATRVLDAVEARDRSVMQTAGWRTERIAFNRGWRWRLERLRQSLAAAGWSATGLAVLEDAAHSGMTRRLIEAARATPADLYIAHYVAAIPAAAEAARCHGALYAFDAEDFHLGDLPDAPRYAKAKALIRAIEGRLLPGAAYVTAASPGIADAYVATYGIPRPTVILNTSPRHSAPPAPTPCGVACPGPSLYWFSQTIGPDRGLECAVDAIARAASSPHLYLRGMPARGYIELLRARAIERGVGDRVHVLEPAMPAEMERLASLYDVGLVGETGATENRRIALTNKIFTYLSAGIPALLSDVPAHRAIADDVAGAVMLYPASDPGALAQAIDRLLSDPGRLAAARDCAHALGQSRFAWERDSARLLELVGRTLRTTVPWPNREAAGARLVG